MGMYLTCYVGLVILVPKKTLQTSVSVQKTMRWCQCRTRHLKTNEDVFCPLCGTKYQFEHLTSTKMISTINELSQFPDESLYWKRTEGDDGDCEFYLIGFNKAQTNLNQEKFFQPLPDIESQFDSEVGKVLTTVTPTDWHWFTKFVGQNYSFTYAIVNTWN